MAYPIVGKTAIYKSLGLSVKVKLPAFDFFGKPFYTKRLTYYKSGKNVQVLAFLHFF